jgi:hypothetical protein
MLHNAARLNRGEALPTEAWSATHARLGLYAYVVETVDEVSYQVGALPKNGIVAFAALVDLLATPSVERGCVSFDGIGRW